MGMKRKDALKRLIGLAFRVQIHLQKITANPEHREANHWKREVRGWLMDMEELLPQMGRRTGMEWENAIAGWKHELEQFHDE